MYYPLDLEVRLYHEKEKALRRNKKSIDWILRGLERRGIFLKNRKVSISQGIDEENWSVLWLITTEFDGEPLSDKAREHWNNFLKVVHEEEVARLNEERERQNQQGEEQ